MAHGEAEHGVDGEQHYVLGSHDPPGRQMRWVCGAGPHAVAGPAEAVEEPPTLADEADDDGGRMLPKRGVPPACRTRSEGWAGAHPHLAVRPRRRGMRRERPPGRWC
ncbi:hypothetical protein [Micromonospora sp. CPCC 206061]|uniref:hypothetical protein n=1 Tax=Micromonospora sp. CPCC 206061 TaxID=3122410 RepID=UPI002FF144B4